MIKPTYNFRETIWKQRSFSLSNTPKKNLFVFPYSYPHISVQFVSKQDMSLSVYVHSSPSSLTLNLSRADNLSFKSTCILLDWSNPSAFNRTQQQLFSNCLKPWRSKFDEPLSFSQRIKICEECMYLLRLRFQKYSNWNEEKFREPCQAYSHCWSRYFELKQIDTFNKAVQPSPQQINSLEPARQLDSSGIILMEIAHY